MFIGREKELATLEKLYTSDKFEFLVLFGRRRIGKTSLLQEFSKRHKTIFFSAQEKNDALNLADLSKIVQKHFEGSSFGTFSDWNTAFEYAGRKADAERVVLIIDEFPFIASENPTIKSILQHIIDHNWKSKNIFLIICGSSVSFMENEVMGYKSPLYGRATAQLEMLPFDYIDAAKFFPNYSYTDKLIAYGILGGVPCYLNAFDGSVDITANIAEKILGTGTFLKDEPQLLLKTELREPAVYNSIFEAIAGGANRLNEISQKIHEESYKCSKYINTLKNIKLINKITPCGEKETSKHSIYRITDNYFMFWYKFLFANKSQYDFLGERNAAETITEELPEYMGRIFKDICLCFMERLARAGKLPFIPHDAGRWWGNNPLKKQQDDIDILMLDKSRKSAIFCECKFKNSRFDMHEYNDLMDASEIFKQPENRYYFIFSKGSYTEEVISSAKVNDVHLLGIDDLFAQTP